MRSTVLNVSNSELIETYLQLNSSYKVAEKYNTSATVVKRILKELGVLRNQSVAASIRNVTCPSKAKGHKKSQKMRLKLKQSIRKSNNPYRLKHGNDIRSSKRRKEEYEYIQLKKQAFNRDNHECQNCKVKDNLCGHHILPYKFKRKANLDIDNIITLCKKCHFTFGHNSNWKQFNIDLVNNTLIEKYSLSAERLNEMASSWKMRKSGLHK